MAVKHEALFLKSIATGLQFAAIDTAAAGDTTLVASVAGAKIRVYGFGLVVGAAITVRFKSGAATNLTGPLAFAANGGVSTAFSPVGLFETALGEGLVLNLSVAGSVGGWLVYGLVSRETA